MAVDPLFPHQEVALRKLNNGKILWGGVGSGKTRVAAEYYMTREAPRDVYVITTAKKRDDFDWQQQFYELGIGPRTGPVPNPGDRPAVSKRRAKALAGSGDVGVAAGRSGAGDLVDDGSGGRPAHLHAGGRGQATPDPEDGRSGLGSASDLLLEGDQRGGDPGIRRGGGTGGVYPYVLTVDSWNNIAKYADVAGAFFIFDEQRLVGSGDWTRKFLRIAKRNRWILLSATPGDTWMDYVPVFVANNFYKNRTEFKREHVVYNTFTKFPKVDRYINVGRLARQRHQLLVEMPYVRHTRRRHVEVPLRYDKQLLERVLKDRWHVYEERPLRDVGEMCLVARRVVNSDPSRLEMVCELWKEHPKLIVFYNFNYELESLRSLREYYGISSTETGTSTKTAWPGSGVTTSTPTSTGGFSATPTSSGLVLPGGSARTSKASRGTSATTGGVPASTDATRGSVLIDEWSSKWTDGSQPPSAKSGSNRTQKVSKRLSIDDCGTASTTPWSPTSNDSDPTAFSTRAISEWNGHRHQPIPSTDSWLYLVQYTAGAEGWNCITTNAMAMYSRNYSWKVTEQAYGRIDRLNTPFNELWYYDFMTDSFIDRAIGRALRAKKTFNESTFKGLFEG